MKKAKQLGYAPLPSNNLRSTSPLPGAMERLPSGGVVLGRRGVSPGGEAAMRRPAVKPSGGKVVAPGQVRPLPQPAMLRNGEMRARSATAFMSTLSCTVLLHAFSPCQELLHRCNGRNIS